jgi:carbamoyltransferase|tara:strand:+ start:331 stop:1854 length:1524 start_codon:yes stop_codon:yes gene_type:complete
MSRIIAVHNSHNASICEIQNNKIVYFQEAERIDKNKKSRNFYVLFKKYQNQKFDKFILVVHYNLNIVDIIKKDIENYFVELNIQCKEIQVEYGHHFFHACSSFFNSGFKKSYVLTIDGNGSCIDNKYNEIISLYYFNKNKYKVIFKVYSTDNGEEFVDGKNIYINTISLGEMYEHAKNLCNFKEEGSVMGYSCYSKDSQYLNLFTKRFNHPSIIQKRFFETSNDKSNICYQAQKNLENIILNYVKNIIKSKDRNLCVSGGVFQNTVLNSKILNICPNLYVDPFADDSGLSMGAALWDINKNKFNSKKIRNLNLGDPPNYDILSLYKTVNVTPKEVATLILKKNIVAIYQGRNELGKRALGNRSFLYDPTDQHGKDKINLLKNREWFRPTAGTVLHEHAKEWFDLKTKKETPFMSYVFNVKKQGIPGITHVDNTCRIQTLKKEDNYHYYNLINEFYKLTNVPILLNTSFNFAGKPLVNSVDDAMDTLTDKKNLFKYIYFPEIRKLCYN